MKLIKLAQTDCKPCLDVDHFLKDAGVEYETIMVDEKPEFAAHYGVMSTPVTILLDDDGNEVKRSYGVNRPELEGLIAQL